MVDGVTRKELLKNVYKLSRDLGVIGSNDSSLNEKLRDIGSTLFQMFLSAQTGAEISSLPIGTNVIFYSHDHEIPWELLYDGSNFLSLQRIFTRMSAEDLRTPGIPEEQAAFHAIVIYNPTGDLEHAESEGRLIASTIESQCASLKRVGITFGVQTISGTDAVKAYVIRSLDGKKSPAVDLVHYSGHVAFIQAKPHSSGFRLSDGILRCYELPKLTNSPIVFVNGCQSARSGSSGSLVSFSLARGLAQAFIAAGASAYIGSLFPVEDEIAAEIAKLFHEHLFQGLSVAECLHKAISAVNAMRGFSPTLLSYSVAGDPTARLALFRPSLISGDFVNEMGVRRVAELEKEYSGLELLLVNDLPWVLWNELDFIDWVKRTPLSTSRREVMSLELFQYRLFQRQLILGGKKSVIFIINRTTVQKYIEHLSDERWDALDSDLERFMNCPNCLLLLFDAVGQEMEELEICSKDSSLRIDPARSVYVFNKQTRHEESALIYSLYAHFDSAIIKEYHTRFIKFAEACCRQYTGESLDVYDIFSIASRLNRITHAGFRALRKQAGDKQNL
jgi:hypothetical protein